MTLSLHTKKIGRASEVVDLSTLERWMDDYEAFHRHSDTTKALKTKPTFIRNALDVIIYGNNYADPHDPFKHYRAAQPPKVQAALFEILKQHTHDFNNEQIMYDIIRYFKICVVHGQTGDALIASLNKEFKGYTGKYTGGGTTSTVPLSAGGPTTDDVRAMHEYYNQMDWYDDVDYHAANIAPIYDTKDDELMVGMIGNNEMETKPYHDGRDALNYRNYHNDTLLEVTVLVLFIGFLCCMLTSILCGFGGYVFGRKGNQKGEREIIQDEMV